MLYTVSWRLCFCEILVHRMAMAVQLSPRPITIQLCYEGQRVMRCSVKASILRCPTATLMNCVKCWQPDLRSVIGIGRTRQWAQELETVDQVPPTGLRLPKTYSTRMTQIASGGDARDTEIRAARCLKCGARSGGSPFY